ncbi:MAG: hypothetical protein U9Q97_08285, partial [Acidobacteriota bacterium]|nr:hypothetical protein [Acidobacteriota bacterium]
MEKINELIVTYEKRGHEIRKFIDDKQPARNIRLTEPTEKTVKILNSIDFIASALQAPVFRILPPGLVSTIGWGAQTAARALDLTEMLADHGHRESLRAYISDRPNFNSSEEAFEVAMKIISRELFNKDVSNPYIFPGGEFDAFYVTVTGFSAYFRSAAKKINGTWNPWYSPTLMDYENLLRVYEVDYQSYKMAIDKDYRQEIENILIGKVYPDVHNREKIAFFRFVRESEDNVSLSVNFINPDGTELIEIDDTWPLKPGNSKLSGLSWAPDGSRVAFMWNKDPYSRGSNPNLRIVNTDGSVVRTFEIPWLELGTPDWCEVFTPVWSPDGQKIAFSLSYLSNKHVYSSGERKSIRGLYVINSDGTHFKQLTDTIVPTFDQGFSWSPDGEKITFCGCTDNVCRIYVIKADGTSLTKLTGYEGKYDHAPIWSPIDDKIAFISIPIKKISSDGKKIIDRVDRVDVIKSDGTGRIPLTDLRYSWIKYLTWSPDGQRLAYSASYDGIPRISVINADGSGKIRLTDDSVESVGSSLWSPDGNKIVSTHKQNGNWGTYIISFDNTEQIHSTVDLFTMTESFDSSANGERMVCVWSPDGDRLSFVFETDSEANIYTIK